MNITRDDLPAKTSVNGIADRILAIAEQAILQNGGTEWKVPDKEVECVIRTDFEIILVSKHNRRRYS